MAGFGFSGGRSAPLPPTDSTTIPGLPDGNTTPGLGQLWLRKQSWHVRISPHCHRRLRKSRTV